MPNVDLLQLTLSELAAKIRAREVSPVDVTEAALAEGDDVFPARVGEGQAHLLAISHLHLGRNFPAGTGHREHVAEDVPLSRCAGITG